jgi:HEAT repeat protein
MLGSIDETVASDAVIALGQIGEPAVKPLKKALGDMNWRVL